MRLKGNTRTENHNIYNKISNENENIRFNQNVNSLSLINHGNKYNVVFKKRIINNKLNKYNSLLLKNNKELYNLNFILKFSFL